MKRLVFGILLLAATTPLWAWNAAGHRLVAYIAWQTMTPESRSQALRLLDAHPDRARWTSASREASERDLFLEAATWPDDIRHDARFEADAPRLGEWLDQDRHIDWHYVDVDSAGRVHEGQADRQIERLSQVIAAIRQPHASLAEPAYALPWLIHLVADIHQPLHVGTRQDEGGNRYEIENPFNPRQPFTNLHAWWDSLPGPPWLRGKRLEETARRLMAHYPAPRQGAVADWREESRTLSAQAAYPTTAGSLLPIITPEFLARSQETAKRRLLEAGIRLGRLLNDALSTVPRETH